MPKTPEFFKPFHVAANAMKRIRAQADGPGKLELQVVTGGPVFLWRGERSLGACVSGATTADVDFDLAAAATGKSEITLESGIGMLTVWAAAETVGFLRFCGYDQK